MRGSKLMLGGLSACLLVGGTAAAQHPGFGTPEPRPLHERLAEADAVAIATIDAVEPGRIRVVEAIGVRGSVAAAFSLKWAPSKPSPLGPGDRALLLLRGARSPYLLVDEPSEQIRLAESDDVTAWSAAARELDEATSPAAAYTRWLIEGSTRLQREAAIGLANEQTPLHLLAPVRESLVDRALHAEPAELRRFAARAAVRTAEGRRLLLEGLPSDDPEVLATALRGHTDGGHADEPDRRLSALLRSLRHESPAVRGIALRASAPYARDRRLRAALVRIASEDPEQRLQALARQLMKGPQRPTPDRPTATPDRQRQR